MDIKLPDGSIGRFPDDMPQEQIEIVLQNQYGQKDDTIQQEEGIPRAAIQGATFGFGDELIAGIGAIPSSLVTGNTINESYNQILDDERMRANTFTKESPVSSALSEVGGALFTGIGGMGTKAGAKLATTLTQGSVPVKILKGVSAGGGSGGVYGYGTSDGENVLGDVASGVLTGAATGAAFPLLGSAFKKIGTKTIIAPAHKIKEASQKLYNFARQQGADFTNDAIIELKKAVNRQMPTDAFSKKVLGKDAISSFSRNLDDIIDEKMTLESFETLDKRLGSWVQQAIRSGDEDLARRWGGIQGDFRDIVTNDGLISGSKDAVLAHREATGLWRNFAKMRDIEEILENAQTYVGGEASGIKSGFARLAKNKNKIRGYTQEEIKAIKKVAVTGRTEGFLRTLGSRLMTIAGATVGGAQGAAVGHAVSSAARGGASALKGADATKVGRLISDSTGLTTQQARGVLGKIMKLPPKDAEKALRELTQSTSITQGNK